ncbi:MAG TPA: dihydrofolate reductase [Candidatus Saccharimonadales bacterium]|nr:dihydrofolate reductase [Candidatus Saccharimonadales bacterium]
MPKFTCVAAIDEKRGLADDHGIPWLGKIPSDVKHYHEEIDGGIILMGYGTYVELTKPIPGRNIVAVGQPIELRPGFEAVTDAREFLINSPDDVWVFGGAGLFASTFDLITDLHLSQLEGDFGCTKFFPEYKNDFTLVTQSQPITENGITFRFETWRRN